MKRLDDWFPVLSSRPGSLDAKGHSEQGSRDTQETVVSQSLAGAMRCERLGHHAETQAVGLLAVKQAINHYLHLVWLCTNKNQTEGPCTSEPDQRWPASLVRAGLSSERNQSDPRSPTIQSTAPASKPTCQQVRVIVSFVIQVLLA